ncbi:N-acyl homoserine lactonase family protein [Gemmobacter sp.]|uniref:N-acyl homoserine lactonase family protein n=1 Tax=Gemmobacter sp. TaxID=1898957 RepID=UPI002AFFB02D|nr:N-acyl homoserine lactonase family protein [Gemmobacter sp.]
MTGNPSGLSVPDLPDGVYEVYAMAYARLTQTRTGDHFMFADLHDAPMPMDYYVWILRGSQRTVLVDTGFCPDSAAERNRPLLFDPVEGLRQIGVVPELVKDVILTHLHYDHAGGIDRFPAARFHVQDAEVAYATGRCMCHRIGRLVYRLEDVVTLVRNIYAERVNFVDGDADILPGISVHLLPGHSRGMQGVSVQTPRGRVLLASDASHFYANFERNAPFAYTVDVPSTLDTYRRMQQLVASPDMIVPGHDPGVRARYGARHVNGIELIPLHLPPGQS